MWVLIVIILFFTWTRSLQVHLNQIKSTCSKMNCEISMLRNEIDDKMVKKFGMKIDFDEMEQNLLTRLLAKQQTNCDAAKHRDREIRRLKVLYMYLIIDYYIAQDFSLVLDSVYKIGLATTSLKSRSYLNFARIFCVLLIFSFTFA